MWRSVFLHEFIDHRVSNFRAVPGRATSASLALTPAPHAATGINSLKLAPGNGFEYLLDQPFTGVVGISCHIRLASPKPFAETGENFLGLTLIRILIGNDMEMRLEIEAEDPDLLGIKVRTTVRVGGLKIDFGRLNLPAGEFTDLGFEWHSSGQLRMSANGRLTAYTNNMVPGASFDIDKLVFANPIAAPSPTPVYYVSKVFVRALQRTDSLVTFSRMLPLVQINTPDENRCRLRVISNLMLMLDRLRLFMATFHDATSQRWPQPVAPTASPFTDEAIQAHALAKAAGLALSKMLATGDFSNPDLFLDPFTGFLRIVHATLPNRFEQLATEIGGIDIVPENCKAFFEAALEESGQAMEPVFTLLKAAAERVREIAGG